MTNAALISRMGIQTCHLELLTHENGNVISPPTVRYSQLCSEMAQGKMPPSRINLEGVCFKWDGHQWNSIGKAAKDCITVTLD